MKKGFFIKSSLLSVAILSGSAGIINATIPKISENFPNISTTSIELLSTIPSITLLIVMLLGEAMFKKVPKKYLILLGIALVAISGVLPIMFEAYFVLFLSRLILGIGLGLFSNSTVTLVTEIFSKEDQGKMLGYRAALTSIGGAVLVIVGNSSGIAIMFALAGIITMAVSFAFGKLKQKFGDKLFIGSMFIIGISILTVNFSNNFILTAGVFFTMSAAVAVLGPLAFAKVIEASKSSIQGLNTSFVIVAFQSANLLSPYGLAILMKWTGLESMFLGASIIIFMLFIVQVIFERIEFGNLKRTQEKLNTRTIND